jgi:hypothetical protein
LSFDVNVISLSLILSIYPAASAHTALSFKPPSTLHS